MYLTPGQCGFVIGQDTLRLLPQFSANNYSVVGIAHQGVTGKIADVHKRFYQFSFSVFATQIFRSYRCQFVHLQSG